MVKIPRATEGTTKMTTKAPVVKQDVDAFTGTAKAIQRSGQQLNQLADKFREMRDLKEFTEATTLAEQRYLELRKQMATDTDYETLEQRYAQELRKINDEAANGISSSRMRDQWSTKNKSASNRELFRASTVAMEGQIKETQASLLTKIESTRDMLLEAELPEEREGYRKEIKGMVQAYVDAGAVGPEQGKRLVEETLNKLKIEEVDYDIRTRPDYAYEMLGSPEPISPKDMDKAGKFARNKAKEQAYPDLTPDERKEKQGEALKAVKWVAEEAKYRLAEDMAQTEWKAYQMLKAETLTEDEIMDMEILGALGHPGGISKGWATTLRKAKKPTYKERTAWEVADVETKLKQTYDQMGMTIKKETGEVKFGRLKSLEKLQEYREAVVTARAEGYISKSREETLLKKTEPFFDAKFAEVARRRIAQENNIWKNIGRVIPGPHWIFDAWGAYDQRPGLSTRTTGRGVDDSRAAMAVTQIRELVDKRLAVIEGDISAKESQAIVDEIKNSHFTQLFPKLLSFPGAVEVHGDDYKPHVTYNQETGEFDFIEND